MLILYIQNICRNMIPLFENVFKKRAALFFFSFAQFNLYSLKCLILSQSVSSVAQSCPTLCNPWAAACQASVSIINSHSLLKLISIDSVMPPNCLIFCPLLLLLSIFLSIRVFYSESVLCIRWPKYWSFSFTISPSMNIQN